MCERAIKGIFLDRQSSGSRVHKKQEEEVQNICGKSGSNNLG